MSKFIISMIRLFFLVLTLTLGLTLLRVEAFAEVLIIESSDQHSAYEKLPAFLDQLHAVVADFKGKHPTGKVVLLINGDFSGASIWSVADRGWLGYQVLKQLNQDMQVVFVPGNHDGLDWGKGGRGNDLLLKQMKFLREAGIPVLGTNIVPGAGAQGLFSNHFDLLSSTQRGEQKIRIAGFTLESLKQQSGYDPSAKTQPIESLSDSVNGVLKLIQQARKDHVSKVVLAFHESTAGVQEILKRVIASDPTAKGFVSATFAAHDHIPWVGVSSEVPLFNGGGDFDYAQVQLSDEGRIRDSKLSHPIPRAEGSETSLAKTVDRFVKARQEQEKVPWVEIPGYAETRADFVQRRTPLGTHLADALTDWARQESGSELPVVGLYNSTAYRGNTALPEGAMSRGDLKKIYPFFNFAKSVGVSGRELQESYNELKSYGREKLKAFTPQLSSNLRESADGKLEILQKNGSWKALKENQVYNVAMDAWLSENGFKLPHWSWVNDPSRLLTSRMHQDVLVEYAPARLGKLLTKRVAGGSCGQKIQDSLVVLGME